MKTIKLHIISDDDNNQVLAKPMVFVVPNVGDEIRLGGAGREQYYTVTRRVFVYDEETVVEIDRVNIGVVPSA